jgi:hypothetical protein
MAAATDRLEMINEHFGEWLWTRYLF